MKTYSYKELEQQKFIKLNNDYLNREFIRQHNIDSVLILSILLRNYTARGEIVFNINYLLDVLEVKKTNTNRINKIKHTLNSLAATKVLDTGIDFMSIKNDDIVRVDYELAKEHFTIVYDFEVDAILNADTTVDKYAMFYLFVFIKYRLNVNTQVMYWSIKDMAREMNTKSNKTVLGYIDTLEKIGLIKVANVGTRVFADNSVKQANNIYTLGYLEDTDEILQEQLNRYKAELDEHNVKVEKGKKQSEQTSIKLRLNNLWEKYHDNNITDEELRELKKKQKKYYEFIKFDKEKVKNTPFIDFSDTAVAKKTKSFSSNDNMNSMSSTDKLTQKWLDSLKDEEYEQDGENALDVINKYKSFV